MNKTMCRFLCVELNISHVSSEPNLAAHILDVGYGCLIENVGFGTALTV